MMARTMSAFRARRARPWGAWRRRRPSTPWRSTGRSEVDEANPTALDRIEQLQQRLDAMTSAALVLARQQDQHQGLGY